MFPVSKIRSSAIYLKEDNETSEDWASSEPEAGPSGSKDDTTMSAEIGAEQEAAEPYVPVDEVVMTGVACASATTSGRHVHPISFLIFHPYPPRWGTR